MKFRGLYMKKFSLFLLFSICFSSSLVHAKIQKDSADWLPYTIQKGDYASKIFEKYHLNNELDIQAFWEINQIKNKQILVLGVSYKLPIKVYPKMAGNIRSTIGISDYNHALRIQNWNLHLEKEGIKTQKMGPGKELWVRKSDLSGNYTQAKESKSELKISDLIDTRLFGKEANNIQILDSSLKGSVFYIISGHGGPDPGTNITLDGHFLCEDEYAYDVSLRLAKELVQKSAKVYMIVQDFSHGIREEKYLKHDRNEKVIGNKEIPLNQIKRLQQRTDAVNQLYQQNKNKYTHHRCIEIHVDSRSKKEQIDVFFYHHGQSSKGKDLSNLMLETFKNKYETYQKGRGYQGEIKTRNLYTIVHAHPTTVYIELGNIQHKKDQQRILIPENREALAKWMAEAVELEKKKNR